MRLLKVACADLNLGDMRGDRENRHPAAMAVEQSIDQVQVAGPAAACTHRKRSGQIRFGSGGKRGNPVILPKSVLNAVMRLEGDVGARHIIETSGLPVVDIEIGEAAHLDVDTPEAVVAAGGVLKG